MLKIELNKNEHSYLCKALFLDARYRKLVFSSKEKNNRYILEITEDQADEIRDLCGEQLQVSGFDAEYELTQEGRILESLVDKFFIG